MELREKRSDWGISKSGGSGGKGSREGLSGPGKDACRRRRVGGQFKEGRRVRNKNRGDGRGRGTTAENRRERAEYNGAGSARSQKGGADSTRIKRSRIIPLVRHGESHAYRTVRPRKGRGSTGSVQIFEKEGSQGKGQNRVVGKKVGGVRASQL